MTDLDDDERVTLELIASRDDHVVFDGATLSDLHRRGLVAFSIHGWVVTERGERAVSDAPAG